VIEETRTREFIRTHAAHGLAATKYFLSPPDGPRPLRDLLRVVAGERLIIAARQKIKKQNQNTISAQ